MDAVKWDDPVVEERWCAERRQQVVEYLSRQGIEHGNIGLWPAWHVVPYVSIWAIESLRNPGSVGWWAISGDLPTDYTSAGTTRNPRAAMRRFADTWNDVAACMRKGIPHAEIAFGPSEQNSELAPLLERRAEALNQLAADHSLWPDGCD